MIDKRSLMCLTAGILLGLSVAYTFLVTFPDLNKAGFMTGVQHPNIDEFRESWNLAKEIKNICSVRIFCLVMTYDKNHRSKADQVMASWGRRCDKLMFMSNADDPKLPVIKVNVTGGRNTLTDRHTAGFDYAYKHHLNDFDWFFKADDDTYAIIENLRYLGINYSINDPIYFGHAFQTEHAPVKQGYASGGSGYVLSRAALERYGQRQPGQCQDHGGDGIDDLLFGRCLQKVGVKLMDSRDRYGKSRFHCLEPKEFILGFSEKSKWVAEWDKYGTKQGSEWMSRHAISFHYVTPERNKELEYFIYRLQPYGTWFDPNLNCTAVRNNMNNDTLPTMRRI